MSDQNLRQHPLEQINPIRYAPPLAPYAAAERTDEPINWEEDQNVYYWYYAAQLTHHMEGEYWKRWNRVMRQILPEQQIKRAAESGSWDPQRPTLDQWGSHGGRLYVTTMNLLSLEVKYRLLPLYEDTVK